MDVFDLAEVVTQHGRSGNLYHEFFAAPRLSLGLYVLPAGQPDPQRPHTEDEVYYVISGKGMVQVGNEERHVTTGSTVYVGEGVDHRFHSITEDLTLMVVFAPPRLSRAAQE